MRRAALGGLILALALLFGWGTAAAAAGPSQQGWWYATGGIGPAAAPDVPADGLLIQGGASVDSPTAFAALVYSLPTGAATGTLTLEVVPNSGTVPNAGVKACRLTATFVPAQGGAMADAPMYDCGHSVGATVSSGRITIDTSELRGEGDLAIALLPQAGTDRLVLARPGPASLQVDTPAASSSELAPNDAANSSEGTFPSPEPLSASTFQLNESLAPPAPQVTGSAPAAKPVGATPVASSTAGSGPMMTAADRSQASPIAVIVVLLAMLVAGGLWASARGRPEA